MQHQDSPHIETKSRPPPFCFCVCVGSCQASARSKVALKVQVVVEDSRQGQTQDVVANVAAIPLALALAPPIRWCRSVVIVGAGVVGLVLVGCVQGQLAALLKTLLAFGSASSVELAQSFGVLLLVQVMVVVLAA